MEEHFILRAPPALAARLRRVLAEDASAGADAASLALEFSEDGRTGELRIGADTFPAKLLDLPTKVETWKSLDDVNLVKSADIGQIVVVAPPGGALPTEDVSLNGVTVAMRDAQRTHFRKPVEIDTARVTALETDLAKLITGGTLNRPGETMVELIEEWV